MPYGGVNFTQVKPINGVDVATEATILAAPASGKRWRILAAELASSGAGGIFFQEIGSSTDKLALYLAANVQRFFTFGEDGILLGVDKGLQADGPATCVLYGYLIVVEE